MTVALTLVAPLLPLGSTVSLTIDPDTGSFALGESSAEAFSVLGGSSVKFEQSSLSRSELTFTTAEGACTPVLLVPVEPADGVAEISGTISLPVDFDVTVQLVLKEAAATLTGDTRVWALPL